MLPIDDQGYTYLVGQYRYPLDEYSWEIPEGGSPIGESALGGAKRELLEETGSEGERVAAARHSASLSTGMSQMKWRYGILPQGCLKVTVVLKGPRS